MFVHNISLVCLIFQNCTFNQNLHQIKCFYGFIIKIIKHNISECLLNQLSVWVIQITECLLTELSVSVNEIIEYQRYYISAKKSHSLFIAAKKYQIKRSYWLVARYVQLIHFYLKFSVFLFSSSLSEIFAACE